MDKGNRNRLALTAMAVLMFGISCFAQKGDYHIVKTIPVGGEGKWDYLALSPVNNDLYVSHATQVNVIDKTTGELKSSIENTTGVHGIAFVSSAGKGYTSNGKLNTLSVFDIHTNKVIGQIKVGEDPDAIMYESVSKMLFVCNGKSKDLSIVDPKTDAVVKIVPLGGKPETAVSDEAGHLYINIEDKSEVAVLDMKSLSVIGRYSLGHGEEPSGLAIDRKTQRLFAGCDNKLLIVLNAKTGKVVKELPIGEGCDGVGFDPAMSQIYSSNGEDGTLTIIKEQSADAYKVIANIPTAKGAKTLTVDEKTHLLYLSTADFSGIGKDGRPIIVPGTFHVLVIGK
ncbi:MAG: hypothetical protein BGO70_08030 [Bacteroidetes bacterium 43-93]|nr:MAG: hypothetical protein BGO70_08030 [Bacteroidetes bacterium 43-93]